MDKESQIQHRIRDELAASHPGVFKDDRRTVARIVGNAGQNSAGSSMKIITRLFAALITLTAMGMSAAAAFDRGGTTVDQALLVALSVTICASSHLLLAISRSKVSWGLWAFCMIGTVYGHVTFLSYAALRAGEGRAEHSVQMKRIERQIEVTRDALSQIRARPATEVSLELSTAKGWRKRSALEVELSEAKRAADLRNELMKLTSSASVIEVAGTTDIVTTETSRVASSNQSSVMLVTSLFFSILLEWTGAFYWYVLLKNPTHIGQRTKSAQEITRSIAALKKEIEMGSIRPTVKDIRSYFRCSQSKAMELRRTLSLEQNDVDERS